MALPPAGAVREADAVGQLRREVVVQVELFDRITEIVGARVQVLVHEVEPDELVLRWVEPAAKRQSESRLITGIRFSHRVDGR